MISSGLTAAALSDPGPDAKSDAKSHSDPDAKDPDAKSDPDPGAKSKTKSDPVALAVALEGMMVALDVGSMHCEPGPRSSMDWKSMPLAGSSNDESVRCRLVVLLQKTTGLPPKMVGLWRWASVDMAAISTQRHHQHAEATSGWQSRVCSEARGEYKPNGVLDSWSQARCHAQHVAAIRRHACRRMVAVRLWRRRIHLRSR